MKIFEADRVARLQRRKNGEARNKIRYDRGERGRVERKITKKIDRSGGLFGIYDEPRYDEAD